jgi:hypothetical protein
MSSFAAACGQATPIPCTFKDDFVPSHRPPTGTVLSTRRAECWIVPNVTKLNNRSELFADWTRELSRLIRWEPQRRRFGRFASRD